VREEPRGKVALSAADLLDVVRACDARTTLGLRDRALVVLGFATSLRSAELAALELADLTFERRGIVVLVRRSKTDQDGLGRVVGVWPGRRAGTDPVRVVKSWIARRGRWAGPLFARVMPRDGSVAREGISPDAVREVVKRLVSQVGLDPAAYGAHSLRSGSLTASAELGRGDREIMRLSGHTTPAMISAYVRHSQAFSGRNPLAGLL
jgi:integrase